MRRFFIDMDGVLAKWENASLEEMTSPGFFLSRKVDENVCGMVNQLLEKQIAENIEVYIYLPICYLSLKKKKFNGMNNIHISQ